MTSLEKSDWMVILIFGALSALLFCRGISALITGVFIGTARFSGAFEYHGLGAHLTGIGYIFLAALVSCTIPYQLRFNKKKVTIAMLIFGIMAALFLGLGLFVQ